MISYDKNFFMSSMPNIVGNGNLRKPQQAAYFRLLDYFNNEYENRNALVVLPTGVGKTGVMALAPFRICKQRTLIITPGTTIRNTILESLTSESTKNFWYKTKVFDFGEQLPNVIEYLGMDTTKEMLNVSNIVVLNIHKLQERLDSSLTKRVESDFFDLIIIDEAHHSTAETWVECVNYFKEAKVIKLTGTPFRTDGEKINGHLVYKYPLSRAMHNGYVKSLQNIIYVPDELKLTIDDGKKEYTVEEIFDMGLREIDWVTRTVAYSRECSLSIVKKSIEVLKDKMQYSSIPHKIIAIACSIKHAKDIADLYAENGVKATVVHSKLTELERNQVFSDIDNNRVQVIVNVAMLGEGYDHEFLSIAAIFRPFRAELPYVQFIGRVLRKIQLGDARDNVAQIISHEYLFLNNLWEKYKIEINESEIIKSLKAYDEILDEPFNEPPFPTTNREIISLGNATESETYTIHMEDYLTTELIRKSKEEEEKIEIQIKKIIDAIGVNYEEAKAIVIRSKKTPGNLNRPDLIYQRKKTNLDELIREEIVPELIQKYNINKDSDNLKNSRLFEAKYWYIINKVPKNDAMLAMYFNCRLKDKIGKQRKQWTDDDFNNALEYLGQLKNFVEGIIKKDYN